MIDNYPIKRELRLKKLEKEIEEMKFEREFLMNYPTVSDIFNMYIVNTTVNRRNVQQLMSYPELYARYNIPISKVNEYLKRNILRKYDLNHFHVNTDSTISYMLDFNFEIVLSGIEYTVIGTVKLIRNNKYRLEYLTSKISFGEIDTFELLTTMSLYNKYNPRVSLPWQTDVKPIKQARTKYNKMLEKIQNPKEKLDREEEKLMQNLNPNFFRNYKPSKWGINYRNKIRKKIQKEGFEIDPQNYFSHLVHYVAEDNENVELYKSEINRKLDIYRQKAKKDIITFFNNIQKRSIRIVMK